MAALIRKNGRVVRTPTKKVLAAAHNNALGNNKANKIRKLPTYMKE